ncbi:MAG: glycosyltransferase family 4 protein [Ginsengibacter sp.]
MKLILYHSQGNANVRATAVGLAEANLLQEFHTSIACFPGSFLDALGGLSFFSEIRRRRFDKRLKRFTNTSPSIELARLISLRVGFRRFTKHETGIFCVEASIRSLDRKVSTVLKKAIKQGADGVYAYEDGAAFSFQKAKSLGLQCFYDLPTGYWRAKLRILEEQKKRFPEWKDTIPGLIDSNEKLIRKDDEIKSADRIFVASRFTASTLLDFPGTLPPIEIIPYGFPMGGAEKDYNVSRKKLPVKLLFVGSLSQQKGIANLFNAVNALGESVSLTLVGSKPGLDCSVLNSELARHRWIPSMPHHKILQIMREHDVLVFPTLFDGFGLVISEAMSQGTPVIATYNSAGPDLIEHGRNGWLVKAGSTPALQTTIEQLVSNPLLIAKAGKEAMETARLRPWSTYMEELSNAIKIHYKCVL